MLVNYIKIAFRNLAKNRLFSAINIGGMAISFASCLIILLFVWDETHYDSFHSDGKNLYRVYNVRNGNDGATNYYPIVPLPFASYMQKDFPEIESTLRIMDTYGDKLFQLGDKKILEPKGIYAEAPVFDMLDIPVKSGSASKALEKPNTVALSVELAQKYFGNEEAVGKLIKIGSEDYEITAVFTKPATNFHLDVQFIVSFATVTKGFSADRYENWQQQQYFTYLKLKPGSDATALEAKFIPFVEKYAYPKIKPQGFTYVTHLQNIRDIHLHSSNFEWDIATRGDANTVYILSVTGLLLLVISCLNFINLSTARSVKRMKEVGVRKVVGALRRQLVVQFISEATCITFLALIFAVVGSEIGLVYLNAFAHKTLAISFSPLFIAAGIATGIFLGAVAGAYPAFYLSRFKPATVIHNKNAATGGAALFRHGLVTLQFVFSFFLVLGAMIVLSQNELLHNKDLGFKKDQLVMIELRSKQLEHQDAAKQEFSQNPGVVSTSICFGIPGDIIAGDGVTDPKTGTNYPANLFCVDHDYIKTMDMHVVAGRDFSKDFPSDDYKAFVLNETAVKVFGFETPEKAIGQPLDWDVWGKDSIKHGTVVGVVKDFYFKSLREQVTPVVMQLAPAYAWKMAVRIKPENINETLAFLKGTYERMNPEYPFTYTFLDEKLANQYRSEENLATMFTVFTGLAIAVACLGLFALVEYSVNQRAREISIRKIFGAETAGLLMTLTWKYFVLVLIAFVIVVPVSIYISGEWLQRFAYHVSVSPWMYVNAFALIVAITALTTCFQSFKAARANPVENLKGE